MTEKQQQSIRRTRRLLCHSALGAFVGWLIPFLIHIVHILVIDVGSVLSSNVVVWQPRDSFGLSLTVGTFSLLITACGWLFLGLPIAGLITDRQARSFRFMIAVHCIATVLVLAISTLIPWLSNPTDYYWEAFTALFSVFVVWAVAIGMIGGSVFCVLERRQ